MPGMRLVSNKPVHQQIVQARGEVEVNGVTFRTGQDGKPTATVTQQELGRFLHTPGFSIYHDDGSYSGPTGNRSRMTDMDVATARLSAAASEASAHTIIENMLKDGTVTPDVLKALAERAPVVTARTPTGSGTAQPGTTQTPVGTVTVSVQGKVLVDGEEAKLRLRPEPESPQGGEGAPQGTAATPGTADDADDRDDQGGDEDTDLSDPASIAKLPRTELYGLARTFGVKASGKNIEIAQEIAEAFRATDEYRAAQAIAAGAKMLTYALYGQHTPEGERGALTRVDVDAALPDDQREVLLAREYTSAVERVRAALGEIAELDDHLTYVGADTDEPSSQGEDAPATE